MRMMVMVMIRLLFIFFDFLWFVKRGVLIFSVIQLLRDLVIHMTPYLKEVEKMQFNILIRKLSLSQYLVYSVRSAGIADNCRLISKGRLSLFLEDCEYP